MMDIDLSLIVCPQCHGELTIRHSELICLRCARTYEIRDGIPNLLIAPGFEDEDHEERWQCEEGTGTHLINNYLVPLLDKLFPGVPRHDLRLLSIGCGVGIDTELLNAAGFHCHGIDVGNRVKFWAKRGGPKRFSLAAVQKMPFRDEQFDFAFMNCVLPHVGVVGDTYKVAPDYLEQRAQGVADSIRVVKRNGYIMVANPNRACPLDLFHRNHEHVHIPRFHSPGEPFLQSFKDHKEDFVTKGGCRSIVTLPIDNFWGFSSNSKSSRYAVGKVLQSLVRNYFKLLSLYAMSYFRRTALNPWLVVLIRR